MIHETIELHKARITVGHDCIKDALMAAEPGRHSAVFVISQERVWALHGHRVEAALQGLDPAPRRQLIPDGESTKNLQVFAQLLAWLADCGADRSSLIIVLGGGVVGDLSGFVASAYMRGIEWVYIPTTLLSQQDASVGGKTGLNLPQGKNLVGAFWEPKAVIIDSVTLETLPPREINAGYMEFLKHAVLDGEDLYQAVAGLPIDSMDFSKHMALLARGLSVKVGVVSRDPFEKGERRLLNLGHTLGHAIENYTGYGQYLHGEAVGLGMVYVCLLARHMGSDYDYERLFRAVKQRVPAADMSGWHMEKMLSLTLLDKKGVKGIVSWIIPFAPGKVEIVNGLNEDHMRTAFREFVDVMR